MERGRLALLLIQNEILKVIRKSLVVAIAENVITLVQLYHISYEIYIVSCDFISGFHLEIVNKASCITNQVQQPKMNLELIYKKMPSKKPDVTSFIWTITLGILDQFQQSKWLPKALKKTFQIVPKMSQSNQYSPSYQQISQ